MDDRIAEIAPNIFCLRVSPSPQFTYNSFLIVDDRTTLIHTGRAKYFERTHKLLGQAVDPKSLSYIALSHFEGDECGAMNLWLQVAPNAVPVCTPLARASVEDFISSTPRCVEDGDVLRLGAHTLEMFETPHFPHGWDAGLFYEQSHKVLFSSDIGAQPGNPQIVTDRDVSFEAVQFQRELGFLSEGADFARALYRISELEIDLLATQHGSVLTAYPARSFLKALIEDISKPREMGEARRTSRCDD